MKRKGAMRNPSFALSEYSQSVSVACDLAVACAAAEFVVSRAGAEYDARATRPSGNFRFNVRGELECPSGGVYG
jgi:hypothetical protein